MEKLNLKALADKVAYNMGCTKADSLKILKETFNVIGEEMKEGNEVSINGFATFFSKEHAEKVIKNPLVGGEMVVAARKMPKVRFHASYKTNFA